MKKLLHIACGDIYLQGYINIDIQGINAKDLKTENPNETTLDNYFKYPFGSPRREIIMDKRMDITLPWEFEDSSVEGVVMVSCLEHFVYDQAKFILSEIKRVSKLEGKLLISIPDIKETVNQYIEKDTRWCIRLLYCNGKNEYSIHKYGYTFESLSSMLEPDWINIRRVNIINHEYPMIQIVAERK